MSLLIESSLVSPRTLALGALKRLQTVQSPSGVVLYQAYVDSGREVNADYNMVRLAGVTYSLCWAAEVFQDQQEGPSIYAAACRSIEFLLFSAELNAQGFWVSEYSAESGFTAGAKLGASSLLALGLTFAPFRFLYGAQLRLLVQAILEAQLPSGAFRSNMGREHAGNQRYASGEALLALVRFSEQTGDHAVIAGLRRAFDFYRRYYRFDPHPGFLLWHVDTWSRAARLPMLGDEDRFSYAAFAEELAAPLLVLQHAGNAAETEGIAGGISSNPRPGVSTSLYLECLCRIAGQLRRSGREAEHRRYSQAVKRALDFLQRLQVSPIQAVHLKQPERFVGAIRMHLGSPLLRMDNDQHAVTACLASLEEEVA